MKKIVSIILCMVLISANAIALNAAETYSVTVSENFKVLVNGKEIAQNTTVAPTDRITVNSMDEEAVVASIDGVYYPINKGFYLQADADFANAVSVRHGVSMVDGAQVRVGNVTLGEDGKLDGFSDSGLRFVATVDYSDTLVNDSRVEFGIKITAEGSDSAAYIKAEKFQNDERNVFTAAITKLNESNYNRKYTATAYAIVPMHDGAEEEFVQHEVTRSIYQVSVGILKNSSAEYDESLPYTVDDAVKDVLNAYINQTGIRLTYSSDGKMSARTAGKGAYTGDLFFDVTYAVNPDGSSRVTLTPLGEDDGFFNRVEFAPWWKNYIRINNNNSVAVKYISDVKEENGSISFTFTLPETVKYTFDQEDNVTVVSSATRDTITGFKAGKEVTYSLAEAITVLGRAESMDDVVPGSVIMVGYNTEGDVAAVELLASLGMPINPEIFEADFGVYDASDGSDVYKNVITEMYSKSGSKVTCHNLPDTTKTTYKFESSSSVCYRVGIAMENDTPVITVKGAQISTYPSIFENTAKYHNYLYMRYNSETEKVTECVFYCVPKDLDFSGGGEYSDIFCLGEYRVIIE